MDGLNLNINYTIIKQKMRKSINDWVHIDRCISISMCYVYICWRLKIKGGHLKIQRDINIEWVFCLHELKQHENLKPYHSIRILHKCFIYMYRVVGVGQRPKSRDVNVAAFLPRLIVMKSRGDFSKLFTSFHYTL